MIFTLPVAFFLIPGLLMDVIPAIILFVPMLLTIANSLHVHPVIPGALIVVGIILLVPRLLIPKWA